MESEGSCSGNPDDGATMTAEPLSRRGPLGSECSGRRAVKPEGIN